MAQPLFLKAHPKPIVIALTKSVLKPFMRVYYRIRKIETRSADLEPLKNIGSMRVVFVSNHVDRRDAVVAFYLSKLLGDRFYYMSNREQLRDNLYTWILRSCGVYSIARGAVDIASIKYTTKLLTDTAPNRLFMFPEGGAYSRNDSSFPFLIQPFEIMCRAARALRKSSPSEALYVVPVAMRYEYENVDKDIAEALTSLEEFVGIPISTRDTDFVRRLSAIGAAVVASYSRMSGIELDSSLGVRDKTLIIKRHLIESLRSQLELVRGEAAPPDDKVHSELDQAREVLNDLYARHPSARVESEFQPRTVYESFLQGQEFDRTARLFEEAKRLENWVALDRDFFREKMSTHRIIDTIIRLEREITGEVRWSAERACRLRVGKPIEVLPDASAETLAAACRGKIVEMLGEN